jgi:hypothetical protein
MRSLYTRHRSSDKCFSCRWMEGRDRGKSVVSEEWQRPDGDLPKRLYDIFPALGHALSTLWNVGDVVRVGALVNVVVRCIAK